MNVVEESLWFKSTANELNNLLQIITEAGSLLKRRTGPDPECARYLEMIRHCTERAVRITDGMLARVGESEPKLIPADPGPPPPRVVPPIPPSLAPEAVDESPQVVTADGIPIHNPHGPRELVMVVDDEQYVSLLAQRVLTEEGYRVITARDGLQALSVYKSLGKEIALVILDFTLPMMDGAEVFEELLALNPNVAVVLSSGFAEQARIEAMLRRGLSGFLPKPYTHDKLLRQVRTTLDARAIKRQM